MAEALNVLLLEDLEADAQVALAELRRSGFDPTWRRVETESDYVTALQPGLDVILADCRLPRFDARQALEHLRKTELGVPFIVVSATIGDEEATALIKAGAADYVLKDRIGRLGPAVRNALATRTLRERQQRDEEALRESEERTRLILANALDAVITSDTEGRITSWNRQAETLFGWLEDEVLGRRLSETVIPPADRERHEQGLAHFRATGEGPILNRRIEVRALRRDGAEFPVELAITPMRLRRSTIFGAFLRDITARKRWAEELEQRVRERTHELSVANDALQREIGERRRAEFAAERANRLKSQFLANMSHELRTPLNAIIGFSELIHDGKAGGVTPEQKEFLGDILTSSHHLLQLINDVLDLAKVESGKMEFRPERVDVGRVVKEVCDILRSLAASKRIAMNAAIDGALAPVVTDPAKLKQVLYNYLSNALTFTPDEGRITVRVNAESGDHFRLEVQDTGIGIHPQDLDRLFVEFQQLEAGAAKKYPGTGLGLALTKRIVEAQGGRVGVESAPGRGSTFFAVLPCHAGPVLDSPAADPRRQP